VAAIQEFFGRVELFQNTIESTFQTLQHARPTRPGPGTDRPLKACSAGGFIWQIPKIGGLIQVYVRDLEEAYGRAVYKQLSIDLGLRERLLYEMVEVYRAFPNLRSTAKLTWGHYSRLSSLGSLDRMLYLNQAADGGWTVRELDARIK